MKIIKNFLKNKEVLKDIQNTLLGSNFPYYYADNTARPTDRSDYFFFHSLYQNNKQTSSYFNRILIPIIGHLECTYLHRAKINCYTKKSTPIKTSMHVDLPNNGYTLFENGEKVVSVENQLITFDGSLKHCSVAQTDENLRVNINIDLS